MPVLIIVMAISLMNFTIPQLNPTQEIATPSEVQLEEGSDCWVFFFRGGVNDVTVCEVEEAGELYICKQLLDASFVQNLDECKGGSPIVE